METKIVLDHKYADLLLEALEERLYQIAIEMESYKGGPMTSKRKELDKKQKDFEELQHQIISML